MNIELVTKIFGSDSDFYKNSVGSADFLTNCTGLADLITPIHPPLAMYTAKNTTGLISGVGRSIIGGGGGGGNIHQSRTPSPRSSGKESRALG